MDRLALSFTVIGVAAFTVWCISQYHEARDQAIRDVKAVREDLEKMRECLKENH